MSLVHHAEQKKCQHRIFNVITSLVLTTLLLFFYLLTYGYLLSKVQKLRPPGAKFTCCLTVRRKFLVPVLIILVLVLFSALPDAARVVMYRMSGAHGTDIRDEISCLYTVHFICDGVIYIFCQPPLRVKVVGLLWGGGGGKGGWWRRRTQCYVVNRNRCFITTGTNFVGKGDDNRSVCSARSS